jgi:hypothetical protein
MVNNKMLHTGASDNIAFAIYGGNNFSNVNDTCKNTGGNVSVLSFPFVATNVNCTNGVETKDTTVSIIHDTPVNTVLPPVTGRTLDSTVSGDTISISEVKIDKKPAVKTIFKVRNFSRYDTIFPARDSTILIQTPAHDTTIKIPKTH